MLGSPKPSPQSNLSSSNIKGKADSTMHVSKLMMNLLAVPTMFGLFAVAVEEDGVCPPKTANVEFYSGNYARCPDMTHCRDEGVFFAIPGCGCGCIFPSPPPSMERVTESPVTVKPVTESPASVAPVPVPTGPISSRPVISSPSPSQATYSPATKSPVTDTPVTQSPESSNPVTSSPVSRSPVVTGAPIVLELCPDSNKNATFTFQAQYDLILVTGVSLEHIQFDTTAYNDDGTTRLSLSGIDTELLSSFNNSLQTMVSAATTNSSVVETLLGPTFSAYDVVEISLNDLLLPCIVNSMHMFVPPTTNLICADNGCRPVVCPLINTEGWVRPSDIVGDSVSFVKSDNEVLFGNNTNCTIIKPDGWDEWASIHFSEFMADGAPDDFLYRADFDNDGLSNILEFYGLEVESIYLSKNGTESYDFGSRLLVESTRTDPFNVDTDGDLFPDGYEWMYGMNPLIANSRSLDTDGDGLDDFQERIFQTNPFQTDTDSDGASDKEETDTGADPRSKFRDPRLLTSASASVTLTVGDDSGSESERYNMIVGSITHQAREFGRVEAGTYEFLPGDYKISITHTGSNLRNPDYDYLARVSVASTLGSVSDPQGILGTHRESSFFFAAGKTAQLSIFVPPDSGGPTSSPPPPPSAAQPTLKPIGPAPPPLPPTGDSPVSTPQPSEFCNIIDGEDCGPPPLPQLSPDGLRCKDLTSCLACGAGIASSQTTTCRWVKRIGKCVQGFSPFDYRDCDCYKCRQWYERQVVRGFDWIAELPLCPCRATFGRFFEVTPVANVEDTRVDPNIWSTDLSCWSNDGNACKYHPGAAGCIRSDEQPNGTGQQCCYRPNGDVLTVGNVGAGTPDRGHWTSPVNHAIEDVDPYTFCCVDCEETGRFCPYYVGPMTEGGGAGARADSRECTN